jgi:hypothetical protein
MPAQDTPRFRGEAPVFGGNARPFGVSMQKGVDGWDRPGHDDAEAV